MQLITQPDEGVAPLIRAIARAKKSADIVIFRFDIKEIEVLGDWAYMRNHLTVTMTPRGGKPMRRSGYTLTILRKNAEGRWLLARDANLMTAPGA